MKEDVFSFLKEYWSISKLHYCVLLETNIAGPIEVLIKIYYVRKHLHAVVLRKGSNYFFFFNILSTPYAYQ